MAVNLPAQNPELVKDINTIVSSSGGSNPNYSRSYPGNVYSPTFLKKTPFIYFSATTMKNGNEPYMSAGTVASTKMLGDINPGAAGSSPYGFTLTADGKSLFFRADNGTTGSELWVCNLTTATPTCKFVKDIQVGSASSYISYMAPIGTSSVVFYATTTATGYELFISDGTATGTKLLKDLWPGTSSGYPRYMTTSIKGDKVFFYGQDGTNGYEPWVTDGTAAGTVMIKNVNPTGSSYPYRWVDMGTATVTKMITVMNDGTNGNELWTTDGTAANTKLVKDIQAGTSAGAYMYYSVLHNGILYFRGNDGSSGYEMWQTDGTATGTKRVADLWSGSSSGYFYYPAVSGGKIFFRGQDGTSGYELFVHDPVAKTTKLVKDIYSGSSGSSPSYLAGTITGKLFFYCNDGTGAGYELWVSDGTSAGTKMVKDTWAGSSSGYAYYITETVPGRVCYRANDGLNGYELWVSDGTTAGTQILKIETSTVKKTNAAYVNYIEEMNGKIYFSANDGVNGYELWTSDGTAAGTTMVKDINPGSASGYAYYITRLGNKIYFRGYTSATGYELWESDGTSAGTKLLVELASGSTSSYPQYLQRIGDKIYFTANSGAGYELHVTDGTAAGTKQIADLNPGTGSSYGYYSRAVLPNGKILFGYTYSSATGYELGITDGTTAGTKIVDLVTGSTSSYPKYLVEMKGKVYMSANTGSGYELHETDGTAAGTKMVVDLVSGTGSSYWYYLATDGHLIYGYVFDSTGGYELWASDGTKTGTKRLADIVAGTSSSYVRYPSPIGSRHVYFQASTPSTGYELFRWDGKAVKSWDMWPGSSSGYAQNYGGNDYRMVPMNGYMYFRAQDGVKGYELYRIKNGATATNGYPACSDVTLTGTDPLLSATASMTITNPNKSPISALLLGLGNPAPFNLPGSVCPLFVNFSTMMVMGVTTLPSQTYNWPVPNDKNLIGSTMVWQVVDVAPLFINNTFDTSNPLMWTIDSL